jgi:hypothetical protein
VPVALGGRGVGGRARHGGGAGRDDHRRGRVGLALGHGAVDRFAVVGAVGVTEAMGPGSARAAGRPGRRRPPRWWSARRRGSRRCGIDREVEFAPGPPATLAVRLASHSPGAVDLQARWRRSRRGRARPLGLRQRAGERQAGAAPGEGGVVGHADAQAEQGGQRAQQALGLPPGPPEGQAQQVPGLDGDVRILRRPAPPARPGRDARPPRPPASPTPSGCRVAGAPCRTPASWSPCSAPGGSCGGAPHWPCRASVIRTTEPDPILPAPTSPKPPALIYAPTPRPL